MPIHFTCVISHGRLFVPTCSRMHAFICHHLRNILFHAHMFIHLTCPGIQISYVLTQDRLYSMDTCPCFRVQEFGFGVWVQGLGLGFQGLKFSVQCIGFKVQGLGLIVLDPYSLIRIYYILRSHFHALHIFMHSTSQSLGSLYMFTCF